MMEEELIELLGELSIEENEFDNAKRVFQGAPRDDQDIKRSYEILSKCSQKPKLSDNIYRVIEEDILKVLCGLQIMDDSKGTILINAIQSRVANDDLKEVILKILSQIQIVLKRTDSLDHRVFYLSLYFAMISKFNICYPQHVSLMLQYLNPIHNQGKEKGKKHEIYSLVLLIIIKNLEISVKETTEIVSSYLEILTDNEPDEISITSFLNLVKCLDSLFPIVPVVSHTIYMSENCKKIILFQVSKMSSTSLEYTSNQLITSEILKLVSSSCINEQCRSFNYTNYLELLKIGTRLQGENILEIRLLSSLCIIKLWNFIQLEKDLKKDSSLTMSELSDILINYLRSSESELNDTNLEYCVEGLAYLTLNTSVKQKLRNDENAIENILVTLKKKTDVNDKTLQINSSLIYGLLLILSNLTKLKDLAANSQKKTTNYLKNFATPNNINEDKDENQENVHNFNSSLLKDYKVVELMSKLKVYKTHDFTDHNNNIVLQVITIISMISSNQDKSTRQELIKQGALNIILDYLIKNSVVKKDLGNETRPRHLNNELVETRLLAMRSLAKLLISVNPSLAFNKYDIKTCLPFLIELLGPDISQYTGSLEDAGDDKYLYDGVSNLDKYESLLALTNISAIQNSKETKELRPLIISKAFDKYLDNFIIDSDLPQIQKASWELISNLITEPNLLAKFFNIEKNDNLKRLQLLIKLLNSTDVLLQIVIGGLMANATSEFEMISQILVKNVNLEKHLLSILTNIFESQNANDDLLLRASYILLNLVYSALSLGTEYINKLREDLKLKTALGLALRSNKNKEILEIIVEIIKLVNFK